MDGQAHNSFDFANIDITTMHANQPDPLPRGNNANIIHSFKSIAKITGQVSQIMNFLPIDHDSPIWYVSGNFSQFDFFPKFELTLVSNSKYDITKNVFVNSYPWLFPVGIGDMYDLTPGKVSIQDWGKHLLQYYNGRFLEDSLFGLFLYNTIQRHSNNSKGNFFLASD